MVSHAILQYVSKVDCPVSGAYAREQLTAWLKENDPFLETKVHRKIKKILASSSGKNARRFLQHFSSPSFDSLDACLEGLSLAQKEVHEASCFYTQVTRVFTHRQYSVAFVIDICAGNGLNGMLWLLSGAAQHVYFIDKNIETASGYKVRKRLDALGYASSYSYLCQDITHQESTIQELEAIQKNHHNGTGIITAMHACGTLTDKIMLYAHHTHMPFAVVPCCQKRGMGSLSPFSEQQNAVFAGYFTSESDYVDTLRVVALVQRGYDIQLCALPSAVTLKNRVIIGFPTKNN